MVNEETAFREVNEAMAEETRQAFFKKYGALVIGGATALVAGVAGYQICDRRADLRAETAALAAKDYETALSMFKKAADDVGAPEAVRQRAKEFSALAAAGKAGVNLTGEARLEDLSKALDETAQPPAAPVPAPPGGEPDSNSVEDQ